MDEYDKQDDDVFGDEGAVERDHEASEPDARHVSGVSARPTATKQFTILIRGHVAAERGGKSLRARALKALLEKCVILDGSDEVTFDGPMEVLIK